MRFGQVWVQSHCLLEASGRFVQSAQLNQRCSEGVVSRGEAGSEANRLLAVGDGFLRLALFREDECEETERFSVMGVQLQGAPATCRGRLPVNARRQGRREVVVSAPTARFEPAS